MTRYPWNPKQLGVQKSSNGPHENDVWAYLTERGRLELVIQTNLNGKVLGHTTYKVRLPRQRGPNAKAADRLRRELRRRGARNG